MWMWMNENQACWSQVHVTAFLCLRVKLKKQGLNRRLKPILWGGAWFSPNTLSRDQETDGQHDTRKGPSGSDLAHCYKFLNLLHDSSTPIHYTLLFFTGEDDYSQDRFPAIHWVWVMRTSFVQGCHRIGIPCQEFKEDRKGEGRRSRLDTYSGMCNVQLLHCL